jgi:pimeloyl-ACP methyl ester carboxylesterase
MSGVRTGVLECDGLPIPYREVGEGQPVLIFPADQGSLFDDMVTALATHYRVIVLDVPVNTGTKQDFAKQLLPALARIGVGSFSVIGVSCGTTAALAQAVYTSEQVHRLILVSPARALAQDTELGARLSDIKTPTLVLVGTLDRSGSREAGHTFRENIPTCHLLLVYDAGHAIAADRHDACLAPIGEFLEQGEGFIVFHDSQMIRP